VNRLPKHILWLILRATISKQSRVTQFDARAPYQPKAEESQNRL
jgi:hypothetical protein